MERKQVLIIIGVIAGLFLGIGIIIYQQIFATPTPPKISYELSKHRKGILKEFFKSCNWTGYKSKLVKACNYSNSKVRNYSVELAGKSSGEFNIGQVCDIFDHYYSNWKYVNDPPAKEYVAKASETIKNNFNGDCDDFAVLMCSSILAIGGEARLNFAHNDISGHAFTEVNLGHTNIDAIGNYLTKRYFILGTIWYREDEKGNKWLNLDWFAKHPGGKYFEYVKGTTYYPIQNFCQDFVKG